MSNLCFLCTFLIIAVLSSVHASKDLPTCQVYSENVSVELRVFMFISWLFIYYD
jgi:hypothetical protein